MKASTRALRAAYTRSSSTLTTIPGYLCPSLLRICDARPLHSNGHALGSKVRSAYQFFQPYSVVTAPSVGGDGGRIPEVALLPVLCPGCGGLTQDLEPDHAGFYTMTRKHVKEFIQSRRPNAVMKKADTSVPGNAELLVASSLTRESQPTGLSSEAESPTKGEIPLPPLCDRCHKLLHHSHGVSIHHPSMDSIRDTIWESPHRYNHIYHVLDAADFPLSLISALHKILTLKPPRSQNRRSRAYKYFRGQQYEMSYIITRADLLAPKKEQVDALMPYLIDVLRDRLGSVGKSVRLGNVRCVSAKRGWWTPQLKEDIWSRGGGAWMVGKVNVGKSNLFECVFPKGRSNDEPSDQQEETREMELAKDSERNHLTLNDIHLDEPETSGNKDEGLDDELDVDSLLPPLQPETSYPVMPLVSSLPGTTASPIRLSYGNGRGELVDLPGLSRGRLEEYVREECRSELVMRSRVTPKQQVIKPGQSLLLGGLIRITPVTPDMVILAYSFLPFVSHLTSTEKAIGIQTQQGSSGVPTMAVAGAGERIRSAGVFQLKWDVTKQRAGPLTSASAVGLKADRLPFRIMATDILVEGCGWVELVAQIRRKPKERTTTRHSGDHADTANASVKYEPFGAEALPEVEIFSPEGKFVGERKSMGGWLLNAKPKPKMDGGIKGRPRKSMKGAKKKAKAERKEARG